MGKWTWVLIPAAVGLGFLATTPGCGRREPVRTPESQADAKVRAIQRLADAMAQEPDGAEARGALEDFRNTALDPRKNPNQADEVVAVYRERIQGKYRGFVGDEIAAEMQSLLHRPK